MNRRPVLRVARGGDPVADDLRELVGAHAGVGAHRQLQQGLLAAGQHRLQVALEQRRVGLLRLPLRVLRRQRLDAVAHEERLEVHRLLGPQRAVVVEHRDALGRRHEVLAAGLGDGRDEGDDARLGGAVVPRGQRVGGLRGWRCRAAPTPARRPASGTTSQPDHSRSVLGRLGHRLHHAVEVEAARLLAWRELLEALQPLAHVGAGRSNHEHALHVPALVADRVLLLGALERVHAQVGQRQARATA